MNKDNPLLRRAEYRLSEGRLITSAITLAPARRHTLIGEQRTHKRFSFNSLLMCLALVGTAASAQIRDGSYDGVMECGALRTNPQQGPFSQPVKLHVSGNSVLWERSEEKRYSEVGIGALQNGQVSLDLAGSWSPGESRTGQWRTTTVLRLDNEALSGPATMYSADGAQRIRDCTVRIAVKIDTPATTASARSAEPAGATSSPAQPSAWAIGQRERIQFAASNPSHRWALIRGQLGPEQMITGDLLLPTQPVADGNPVTYKVYPGAYHVFDRRTQPWVTVREGTYAKCAVDVIMPSGIRDVASWGPGFNRATGKPLERPEEFEAAVKQCEGTFWITVESNAKAREQAVKDVLAFLDSLK